MRLILIVALALAACGLNEERFGNARYYDVDGDRYIARWKDGRFFAGLHGVGVVWNEQPYLVKAKELFERESGCKVTQWQTELVNVFGSYECGPDGIPAS